MAWWKKAVENVGPQPATIERIAAALDEFGYNYEEIDGGRGLSSGFDGVGFLFLLEAEGDFVEVSAGWISDMGEERLQEACAWCNDYNRRTVFPRLHAGMVEDGIGVYGESYFWAGDGLTDEQLSSVVAAGIALGVRGITDTREAMGDPIPVDYQGND